MSAHSANSLVGFRMLAVPWLILAPCAAAAQDAPKPVTIRVVDHGTKRPVTRFSYRYRIDSPDQLTARKGNGEAKTEDGVIRIPVPRRCDFWISVETPHYLPNNFYTFKILPSDQKREFTLELIPGITVRGVVLDADTGRPIVGAEVAPKYVGPPPWPWVCTRRGVKTDAEGRFQLNGVAKSLGIYVSHRNYKEYHLPSALLTEDGGASLRLVLGPKSPQPADEDEDPVARKKIQPRLHGRVTDLAGQPVGPYRIVAVPTNDGNSIEGDGARCYEEELKGRAPGKPWELKFIGNAKLYWITAESPGFAPVTKIVPHGAISRPIEFRLGPGFSFAGRISLAGGDSRGTAARDRQTSASAPLGPAEIVIMMQPMYLLVSNPAHRFAPSIPFHKIQVSRVNPREDGRFRFDHLAPGTYMLQAVARGRTPVERLITLGDRHLQCEDSLTLVPAGRIEGIVCHDGGKPMVMESCDWTAPITLDPKVGEALWGAYSMGTPAGSFATDEHGCFALENVPAGRYRVGFDIPGATSFGRREHAVQVLPDRTTQVQINLPADSAASWNLPVEVTVGDGSRTDLIAGGRITNPEFFHTVPGENPATLTVPLALEPLSGQAVSWPMLSSPWTPGSEPIAIPPTGGAGRAV